MKTYKSAPLPFQGQKRRFVSTFVLAMQQLKEKQDVCVVVDLFGGSGLLSHTARRIFPKAKVVYNDFDHYTRRLRNIPSTNKLLADIRVLAAGRPTGIRMEPGDKEAILKRVRVDERKGFVDYITLSSSLLFSSKYVTSYPALAAETFYNNIKMADYDANPDEYLAGLDIVHMDYKEPFALYKDTPGVLFIIDPPYLSTDTTTYGSDKYWRLRDYLDVLNVLVGTNYVFFTSNKSSLVELCEWFADNRHIGNPFAGSVLNTQNVTINKTSGYTDMMLCKFHK